MPGKSNGSHRSYQLNTMREEEDSPGAQVGGEVQGPMRARPPYQRTTKWTSTTPAYQPGIFPPF